MARSYEPSPLTPQVAPPPRDPLAPATEYTDPWESKAAPPPAPRRRGVKPLVWILVVVALALVALAWLVWG
jgi:hypothetical protein